GLASTRRLSAASSMSHVCQSREASFCEATIDRYDLEQSSRSSRDKTPLLQFEHTTVSETSLRVSALLMASGAMCSPFPPFLVGVPQYKHERFGFVIPIGGSPGAVAI